MTFSGITHVMKSAYWVPSKQAIACVAVKRYPPARHRQFDGGGYRVNAASPQLTHQLSDFSADPVYAGEQHQPDSGRHLANASEAASATASLPYRPLPAVVRPRWPALRFLLVFNSMLIFLNCAVVELGAWADGRTDRRIV